MSVDPEKINEQDLRGLFVDIRKTQNNSDEMDILVEYLVDKKTLDSCCYGENNQTFCEAYTIKLFEEYIHGEKNKQLMLAVYGLLDGYRGKSIKERCKKYAKEAAEFDKRIKPNWSDPNASLGNIEHPKKGKNPGIRDLLIKEIILAVKNDKTATCKLAKEVDKELREKFPDGLPEELPLEKPFYSSRKEDTVHKKDIQDAKSLANTDNNNASANQANIPPSGTSITNEENGITKPPSIAKSGQSDEKQKTNDSDPSEKSKDSKKTGKKKKHSKGDGGDTTYDNPLGEKSINLTVPIVFIVNSGNKILKAVKINNVKIVKISCFLLCIVSVFTVWMWLICFTGIHNKNVIGQVFLSRIVNKTDGIHLKPDETANFAISIYPLEADASNAEIKILDTSVATIFLDPFLPAAQNQRSMAISAQKEWNKNNHETSLTIEGENINNQDILVTVDKPDNDVQNKKEPEVFNVYEGDEGDWQEDKPVN